jgi:hypothetical protein
VTYKLELTESSTFHPVFHVSQRQIKKAVGTKLQVSSSLPSDFSMLQVPEKILNQRLITHGVRTVLQVLVKWSASAEVLATWEDMEALKQMFPWAPTWEQLAAKGGGDVTIRVPCP